MKKIALVMDGWKHFFTYAWPAGILQRIRETGEDVNLYIFNSSGDWSRDEDYNIGEYNIYKLPDFKDFDGVILDLNNISHEQVAVDVMAAVKAAGKPAISIANAVEDFYYVGIDNYKAMREMITHLYEVHHCRRFWYVMGPEDNYENQMRVKALKEFAQDHGLPWEEDSLYYENYEYKCGLHGFEALYERCGNIPDAIICANDNIAVGVCEAAARRGYEVPKDFCVTGFDNFDKASFYTPKITTVSHIREEVGYTCADIFLKIWAGEQVPQFNYTETKSIFWESCGCESHIEVDQNEHAKQQMLYELETANFEEQVLALEYELLSCKTVAEMTDLIPKCIPSMRCDAMYLILDDHMNDYKKQIDVYEHHSLIEDEEFLVHGYPDKMNIEFAYENGQAMTKKQQTISSLFPIFDFAQGGTDFLFLPLHFRNRTVGLFVIRNATYLMEKQYLFKVVNVLTSAMENLHKKEKLEYMNQILAEMNIKDSMTGLYNRLGYQKLACKLFDEKKKKGENLVIMFVDMDRLKHINDHFGHEYGDYAIQLISRAILNNCEPDAIPIRTGGDEFLIIHHMMDKAKADKIVDNIRMDIQYSSEKMRLPFSLSFSIGCIYTDMSTDKSLDDYIREADENMYAEKIMKNVQRTE